MGEKGKDYLLYKTPVLQESKEREQGRKGRGMGRQKGGWEGREGGRKGGEGRREKREEQILSMIPRSETVFP